MARSKNRGKKFDPRRSQRRWLQGFSIVFDSVNNIARPCWRGKTGDAAVITWNKNHESIKNDRFNWKVEVWVEFDHGDGKPYREHGEFSEDNIVLSDLFEAADALKLELMGAGNDKFQVDYGWVATILPDAVDMKSKRLTMIDRLERLVKRDAKKMKK